MNMRSPSPHQDDPDRHWHLDRKVPLALVYLLVGQFLGGVVFASNLMSQQANQEKRITVIENQRVSERLVSLESQMADTKALLQRVDTNLLRLVERGSPRGVEK
jgi:hypothetical protein